MNNYYEVLEISSSASTQEIKKAFRRQAKKLHPDIRGEKSSGEMRKLLAAYETLIDGNRRYEYDRAYTRFTGKNFSEKAFDYRSFLRENKDDPQSQAKLIFFELLHLEEDEAILVWKSQGGLDYSLKKYLDREDWMDCSFILAEELAKRGSYYEAFVLLVNIVREERRRPYFRHFMQEVEKFFKQIVRFRLPSVLGSPAVDAETFSECIEALLGLGFSQRDEERWVCSITRARRKLNA